MFWGYPNFIAVTAAPICGALLGKFFPRIPLLAGAALGIYLAYGAASFAQVPSSPAAIPKGGYEYNSVCSFVDKTMNLEKYAKKEWQDIKSGKHSDTSVIHHSTAFTPGQNEAELEKFAHPMKLFHYEGNGMGAVYSLNDAGEPLLWEVTLSSNMLPHNLRTKSNFIDMFHVTEALDGPSVQLQCDGAILTVDFDKGFIASLSAKISFAVM